MKYVDASKSPNQQIADAKTKEPENLHQKLEEFITKLNNQFLGFI